MSLLDDADFDVPAPDQTAEYTFERLPKPITLIVKYAGAANEAFTKARKSAAFRNAKGDDAERLWRQAFAKHVIVGWKGMRRKDGVDLAYSAAGGAELLERLQEKRGDLVDGLLMFVANADNFTAAVIDAVELGNG